MNRTAVLAVLAVLVSGCAAGNARLADTVLARINDEPVTVRDVQDSFTSSHQGHGVFLAGKDAIRQFLDKEIDKRLLVQEARRVGKDQDADVQRARESLRRRRATAAYYKDKVEKKVHVSQWAIWAAYARLGERVDARHILVNSRDEAATARARIAAGTPFGEVARQVSLSDTVSKGGDLGIIGWGQLDPVLEDRLWRMKKGELSQPFETEDGWNLLQVVDRAEVEAPKIEQAQNQIEARLAARDKERRTQDLHRRLLERAGAVFHESVLIDAALSGAVPAPKAVLAEGGGERVTLDQVLPLINPEGLRKVPAGLRERRVRRFLAAELARRLATADALASGYGDSPEVQRELDKATGAVALDRFVDGVVLRNLAVTDSDAEAYWAANPKEFTDPRAIHLSVLFVPTEEEANTLVMALRGGKDFVALARQSKNPGVAASGGDLGWVQEGKLDPALETVAFALHDHEVGVAKIAAGYVVARVEEHRDARVRPFAAVREQARDAAQRARGRQMIEDWVTKLRKASTIEIDDRALERTVEAYEEMAREKAAKAAKPKKPLAQATEKRGPAGESAAK